MKFKQGFLLLSLACSASVFATNVLERNPLSVHVLNLQNGVPAQGVKVTLDKQESEKWIRLSDGVTNSDGRINALYPTGKKLESGHYRVTFETGEYYKASNQETFFIDVPVVVSISSSNEHYHIPLLLSPYGYSTYRGS